MRCAGRSTTGALGYRLYDYLLQHNARPKAFISTKTTQDILYRERRAVNALDEIWGKR